MFLPGSFTSRGANNSAACKFSAGNLFLLSFDFRSHPKNNFGYVCADFRFLVKVAFFDADGTLRVAPFGETSANGERDFFLLPFVTEKIAELVKDGYLEVIVSNQLGVGRHVSIEAADEAFDRMRKLITHFEPSADIHYHDYAEKDDENRKPRTGMIKRLEQLLREKFGNNFPRISIARAVSPRRNFRYRYEQLEPHTGRQLRDKICRPF